MREWVRVLDRWIHRVDQGMGGTVDGGVDPASTESLASDSTPPAVESG
jgi:hypothetical protein